MDSTIFNMKKMKGNTTKKYTLRKSFYQIICFLGNQHKFNGELNK